MCALPAQGCGGEEMNMNFLRTFVCVVEEGNFSRAANRLHLSQPAVSMQMQALAQELGTDLLRRQGHRVQTTEAGALLYTQATQLLASWQDTLHQLESLHQRLQGRLELGASTVPGDYLLPARLCTFYRLHPEVDVRMTVAPSQDIINSLVSGTLDLAVVGYRPENPGLESEIIFQDEIAAILSPEHNLASRRTITPDDLLTQPVLMRTRGSATRQVLEDSLETAGINPAKINTVMELGSGRAILEAVAQNLGIAVVSKLSAADYLNQGRLVWKNMAGLTVKRSFWLVLSDRPRSPSLHAFTDFLRRGDYLG